MSRFKVFLEYEGTRYSGWQIQKNARTVQGEITATLRDVLQSTDFEFYGSGRTDAGVHALMQVAHLEAKTMLAPEILKMKLNDLLPADINILEVEKANRDFHARHDAIARSYLYQISRRRTAFGKRYVWWVKDKLSFQKMQEASKLFLGRKDFRSFTADDPDEKSTTVEIAEVELAETGSLILIRIVGSHFIWKMVRQIVGVLVEVGRGKLSADSIQEMFSRNSSVAARLTAPPSGLFLESVSYRQGDARRPLVPAINIDQLDFTGDHTSHLRHESPRHVKK